MKICESFNSIFQILMGASKTFFNGAQQINDPGYGFLLVSRTSPSDYIFFTAFIGFSCPFSINFLQSTILGSV